MYQHLCADTNPGIFSGSLYGHLAFIHMQSLPCSQKTTLCLHWEVKHGDDSHQPYSSASTLTVELGFPPHASETKRALLLRDFIPLHVRGTQFHLLFPGHFGLWN